MPFLTAGGASGAKSEHSRFESSPTTLISAKKSPTLSSNSSGGRVFATPPSSAFVLLTASSRHPTAIDVSSAILLPHVQNGLIVPFEQTEQNGIVGVR